MGAISFLRDRLTNVMSGQGTSIDRRTAGAYVFSYFAPEQAEAAYRTSWLVRKIVDIPPLDMTREWRDWQTDAANIEKLEAEERRLGLKAKCKRALTLARLYGGGAILLGSKDGNPEEPIAPDRVKAGGLTYLHVMARQQLTLGPAILDPESPWFGRPEYFQLTTGDRRSVKLHPSRVVEFIGQKAPEGALYSQDWFWGDPIMQSIGDAIKNADTAQAGFASLIDEAKVDILRMKDLMSIVGTDEGEARIMARLAAFTMGKSVHRAAVLDVEDEYEQRQVTWTGMPEMLNAYLQVAAGAADIPMTRLLGQSPKGLQSSGDGEERDYHSMVRARQDELLCPALDRIDDLLIRSALGSRPADVYYEFAPLSQMNAKEAADIEKLFADTVKIYSDTGLIPEPALAAMAKNGVLERGQFPGSEAAFEEAALKPEEDPRDDADARADLRTRGDNVIELRRRGAITGDQEALLIADAAPRSLYVHRKLLNGAELVRWAREQGFEVTTPAAEMHATILYSRAPVDWMKMGSDWTGDPQGNVIVPAGGARLVEPIGDKGAVALLFSSSTLAWRHEEMVRQGASHDFPDYQPHVTITYAAPEGLDLATVEPFRGKLVFGPEIFSEVSDDWQTALVEDKGMVIADAPPAPAPVIHLTVPVEVHMPKGGGATRTVVTKHTEDGRIAEFERREIEE